MILSLKAVRKIFLALWYYLYSVATVEDDLQYMLQPSRMYIGDSINVFGRGSLVMEHPGSSPVPIIGKPILYGGVHGTIGIEL